MRIIIPTRGRLSNQITLSNLPKELHEQVRLICPSREAFFHKTNFSAIGVVKQPDDKMTIAQKRKWIIENTGSEKIVMLDDDLRFAVRRKDDPQKFLKATNEEIIHYFRELEDKISSEIPHAGFAARGGGIGNKAQQGGWQKAKRQMYVLGYHVPTVRRYAVFGRIETREDMDVTLQLLEQGFPNEINFSFVVDQTFDNPGGCTNERTMERSNADAIFLANLHPGFVTVTDKTYKSSIPRLEVVVQWEKAFESGLSRSRTQSSCV